MKRVGIIGLGFWYAVFRLVDALRDSDNAKLVAVASPDMDRLKKFTSRFPVEGYLNFEDLLARKDIDIVLVTPNMIDVPRYAIGAAKAGKHIILGARMALNLKDADEVVRAVECAGVKAITLEAEAMFENPLTKKKIEEGLIGEIVHINASSHSGMPEDWYLSGKPGWFAEPGQVLGGGYLDYSIYCIEALRWFTKSEVREINFARVDTLIHKDLKVDDWGIAFFTFANGVTATLEAGWTIVIPKRTKPSPKVNCYKRYEIIGTTGRIIVDCLPYFYESVLNRDFPYWAIIKTPRGLMTEGTPAVYPYLDYLIECIDEDKKPVSSIDNAKKDLEVVMAIYESAKTGKPVLCPHRQTSVFPDT